MFRAVGLSCSEVWSFGEISCNLPLERAIILTISTTITIAIGEKMLVLVIIIAMVQIKAGSETSEVPGWAAGLWVSRAPSLQRRAE